MLYICAHVATVGVKGLTDTCTQHFIEMHFKCLAISLNAVDFVLSE